MLLLGMLGVDFEVVEPPELIEHLRTAGEQYLRAAAARPSVLDEERD